MTTVTAPRVYGLPKPAEVSAHVRRMIQVDASTAKVAMICLTVLACWIVAGVVAVAVLGSDVAAVSAAIAVIIGALARLALSLRKPAKTEDAT